MDLNELLRDIPDEESQKELEHVLNEVKKEMIEAVNETRERKRKGA